jgi:hypothetical protein
MALRFRYQLFRTRQPVLTLGGRFVHPRPVLPLSVIGPTDTRVVQGLLDTGADHTVFSEALARQIGLDLTTAPQGVAGGAGLGTLPVRFAEVRLRLASSGELREWQAWVGFTSGALNRPLFGFGGFLQYFTATFHGDREEVELVVNALYPGTQGVVQRFVRP